MGFLPITFYFKCYRVKIKNVLLIRLISFRLFSNTLITVGVFRIHYNKFRLSIMPVDFFHKDWLREEQVTCVYFFGLTYFTKK
jgi:hypothetical protein